MEWKILKKDFVFNLIYLIFSLIAIILYWLVLACGIPHKIFALAKAFKSYFIAIVFFWTRRGRWKVSTWGMLRVYIYVREVKLEQIPQKNVKGGDSLGKEGIKFTIHLYFIMFHLPLSLSCVRFILWLCHPSLLLLVYFRNNLFYHH